MRSLVDLRTALLGAACAVLLGCSGGDVKLNPTNTNNSVDNSVTNNNGGGGTTNPCASYTVGATVRQGSFDGRNCLYSSAFVGASNPLTVNLTIPFFSGVHIFQDSLFVGTNVSTGVAPAAGTGPTLTIEAGATLAFSDSSDYVLVNRGSTIIANGSSVAPITFTGFSDAVTRTAGPEDVQLWGGIVINGNGITNNCTDAQRTTNACHVESEGQPSHYGGNNNTESSGTLRYVVVKHAGFEVAPDDELNGITFNAVGSGTTVSHVQVYSAFDDGLEFFGGAVNVDHYVGLYVRDDAIDYSDGYAGRVEYALVINSLTDGNRCVEGDNIGDTRAAAGEPLDTAPITNPTVANLTCILSLHDAGTHDTSQGIVMRRGPKAQYINSIVFGGYANDATANNRCMEINDNVSRAFARTGETTMRSTILACRQATRGNLDNGDALSEWVRGVATSTNGVSYAFNTANVIITDPQNTNVSLLSGIYTATTRRDDLGNAIATAPVGPATHLGAVTRADDWTAGWTYGLRAGAQGQPLWFATP